MKVIFGVLYGANERTIQKNAYLSHRDFRT